MARTASARGVAGRIGRWLARVLSMLSVVALVVLAVGGAVGRFKLAPAPSRTVGTPYSSSDLVLVVPVPVQMLRVGDVVIIHNSKEKALLRLEQIVDSQGPQVHFAGDPPGHIRRLGGKAWRVRKAIPIAGAVMRLTAGPIQGILQVVFGLLLVTIAEVRRNRQLARLAAQQQEQQQPPPGPDPEPDPRRPHDPQPEPRREPAPA